MGIHEDIKSIDQQVSAMEGVAGNNANEILALKARIKELEAAPVPVPVPPVSGNRPKLLDEKFDGTSLNEKIFYRDKTVPEKVIVANGRMLMRWEKTSDLTDMRAQIGIRLTPGSNNATPRRDPIGSTRLYAWDVLYPPAFNTTDQWADEKCVGPQWHQGSVVSNPPLSIEQVKGRMRACLSLHGKDRIYFELGATPRVATKMVAHIKWSPGSDGFIRIWRDGVKLADHQGQSCNAASTGAEDINHVLCCYNPGHKTGAFKDAPVGYKREVSFGYWLIGNETNKVEDMVP